MKLARLASPEGPRNCVEQGGRWREYTAADPEQLTGWSQSSEEAALLAPVLPTVIVGLGSNTGPADPANPLRLWLKSPRTVIAPGAPILAAADAGPIVVEGEVALVIGSPIYRSISLEQARTAILGYTIGNDVTAPELITAPNYLGEAKGGAGFTPLGPWIETDFDDADARIRVWVNQELRCDSSTALLTERGVELVHRISQTTPLDRGDLVLTGSPKTGTGVVPGDTVEIAVDGLGSLSSPVASLA